MINYETEITVQWNNANKKHYIECGYTFTNIGDSVNVKIKDLTRYSKVVAPVLCDYCGEYYYPQYSSYNNQKEGTKDACRRCRGKKAKESNLERYGYESPMQRPEIKEKSKQTSLEKYGVEYYAQTSECQDKMKQTCLERYGVERYSSTQEYKDRVRDTNIAKYGKATYLHSEDYYNKTKQTCIERYGEEHYSKTSEYKELMKQKCLEVYGLENYAHVDSLKEKAKDTCLERYGVEFALQSDEVRQKGRESYYTNGTCATSKPQLKIYEILKQEYGNCELNYPCGRYSLDCMLCVQGVQFDIEYDGCYWHTDENRDDIRNKFVINKNYKVLRLICSNSYVPPIEDIKKAIDLMLCNDKSLHIIDYTQ